MAEFIPITIFLASFSLTVIASIVLARRLEQCGCWLQTPAAFLGVIAALGADAPEISSAVTALRAGNHDLGLGIVIGSNIFNIASLLGLSAVVSGCVKVSRRTLWLNGGVAVAILGLTTLQLFGILPGWWAVTAIALVMVPYVTVLALSPRNAQRLMQSFGLGLGTEAMVADSDSDAKRADTPPRPSYADLLDIVPALVSIVLGSIGMVDMATSLGQHWGLASAISGILILAVLTGIPNIVTAVQLARRGRGSAVLSEALNSNTLNLVIGASLPALIFGAGTLTPRVHYAIWTLVGMTLLALGIAFFHKGLGRKGGAFLMVLYLGFVAFMIAYR